MKKLVFTLIVMLGICQLSIAQLNLCIYKKDGSVTAEKGDASLVTNYATVGGDCSRVVVITKSNGDPFQMFILNY